MTDARMPERWLNDRRFRSKRLSDAGYRSYMNALVWSVANRTDGVIERGDLEDIPDFNPAVVPELMGDDLWEPLGVGDSWHISDFDTTQTGRDLLESAEKKRAWDRNRKARERAAKLAAQLAEEDLSGGNSTGTVPVDSYRPGQYRPGFTQRNHQEQPRSRERRMTTETAGTASPNATEAKTTSAQLSRQRKGAKRYCRGSLAPLVSLPRMYVETRVYVETRAVWCQQLLRQSGTSPEEG